MAAVPRRRKFPGQRRRLEDEGEDDGGPDALDLLNDDSLTEGSVMTDENDPDGDSDTSNVDEPSPTSPNVRKPAKSTGNGVAKAGHKQIIDGSPRAARKPLTDTDVMLNGLSIADRDEPIQEMHFDDLQESPTKSSAPIVVSSASASQPRPHQAELPHERRRREHEEYRRKRDEDPAFVPNRGAFFMHDHRGAGPSANGFRPFPRGGARGRGGGRGGGFGGHLGHLSQSGGNNHPSDPTTSAPWAHDMHEVVVSEPMPVHRIPIIPPRGTHNQYVVDAEGPPNGNGYIPRCPPNPTPINRTLSTEKHVANAQVRVFFPPLKEPIIFPGVPVKQYTKLPDHRPPLRRDKPVRISLPANPPRYIYPAPDRSFIFIPRAMRPNQQQRARGKPRSVFGSVGGFSRRTSIYGGGGSYYGSAYSPSIAMSRRSSFNHDIGPPRDYIISPTGSTISRPPMPMDTSRPVVRLPPPGVPPPVGGRPEQVMPQGPPPAPAPAQVAPPPTLVSPAAAPASAAVPADKPMAVGESYINNLPQPQVHPLPQRPNFQESRPNAIPMHQPRPQKTVSVETIESPTMSMNPPQSFQQAFHQQVPPQVSNFNNQDMHHRHPSYPSQRSTGTPLSQIPESAIHAAPFQPNTYAQQNYYGQQPFHLMPPQQGYFYPPPPAFGGGMPPSATAPPFMPAASQHQQQPPSGLVHQGQVEGGVTQQNGGVGASQNPNLITQEVNGTFYYYDASQLPAVPGYPSYGGQQFVPGMVGMPSIINPSPDGFYYPQPAPGMMYFPQ